MGAAGCEEKSQYGAQEIVCNQAANFKRQPDQAPPCKGSPNPPCAEKISEGETTSQRARYQARAASLTACILYVWVKVFLSVATNSDRSQDSVPGLTDGPECRVLYTVAHFVAKSTSIRALASTSERQLRDVCTAARAAFTACLNTARALWLSSARNHSDSLSDHLELLARAAGSIWVEISRLLATISFIFPGVEKRAMLEKEEIMVFESLTTTLQKFIFSCFEERSFVFGNAELEIKSLARILRCLYSHQKSTGQSKQNLKTLENFVKGQASCAGSTETIPLITQADVVAHSCAAVLSELLDRYEDREECSHTSTRPFSELSEAKIARRKKNICLTQDQLWRGTQHLCQLIEECAPFMSLASPANSNEADRSGSSSRFRFCREWLRGQLLASDRSVEDLLEECVPNSRLSKHKHGTQAGFSKVDHRGGLTFSLARIRVLETLLCLQRRYQDDE